MTLLFDTNLSKIKTKLRTQGAVTGNFGHAKTKAGSPLRDIGHTKAEKVTVTKRRDYINRMIMVFETSSDERLRDFAYHELHRLNCFQEARLAIQGRTSAPFRGPIGA
jgi:hypothetical protein